MADVIIIGGGVIGLGIGWQLARRGKSVEIHERDEAGHGASWVSAGMLAPIRESTPSTTALVRLMAESLRMYPNYLRELQEDSGSELELHRTGSLWVALDEREQSSLRVTFENGREHGLAGEWLTGDQIRRKEPHLSKEVLAGLWMQTDAHVDSRLLVAALRTAFQKRGGVLREKYPVDAICVESDRVRGVRRDGHETEAPQVVLAAGSWSKTIGGMRPSLAAPVQPVKGQVLSLRMNESSQLDHMVYTHHVFLVPKQNRRLIIGATEEHEGFDTEVTAGAVMDLLRHACDVIPSLANRPVQEIQAGLGPVSRDHNPVLGATEIEGLFYATGHERQGILLTPVTSYALADLIIEKKSATILEPFSPNRFH